MESIFCMKNFKTLNYIIIYAKNCEIRFKESKNNTVLVPQGTIAIIEKNMILDIEVKRITEGELYDLYHISNDIIKYLKGMFDVLNPSNIDIYFRKRGIKEKVFILKCGKVEGEIISNLKKKSILMQK